MKKVSIAVFGATHGIYELLLKQLNFNNVEIVAFLDNDSKKRGILFENIPIMLPTDICSDEFDLCLVGAWYSYDKVRAQLIDIGFLQDKIQVLLCEDIFNYFVGNIDITNQKYLEQIYEKPSLLIQAAERTNAAYKAYCATKEVAQDIKSWCNEGRLIAHACGGIVNGKKKMYSNSKEALEYSLKNGFKLIECDAWGIDNGKIILGHDPEKLLRADKGEYSLQYMEELIERIRQVQDVYLLIDVKWNTLEDYRRMVDEIERILESYEENERRKIKARIVLEVYNEKTICYARQKKYECIYTQYRNPDWQCFMETVILCGKYDVKAIAISVEMMSWTEKYIDVFLKKNIRVFCFSTDSIDVFAHLLTIGVSGVFTNYLVDNVC